jgi:hypothetical protein
MTLFTTICLFCNIKCTAKPVQSWKDSRSTGKRNILMLILIVYCAKEESLQGKKNYLKKHSRVFERYA